MRDEEGGDADRRGEKGRHFGLGISRSGLALLPFPAITRLYSTLLSVTAGRLLCKGDTINAC